MTQCCSDEREQARHCSRAAVGQAAAVAAVRGQSHTLHSSAAVAVAAAEEAAGSSSCYTYPPCHPGPPYQTGRVRFRHGSDSRHG